MDATKLLELREYLTQQRDLAFASHDQKGLVAELDTAIKGVERERRIVERKRHLHETKLARRKAFKLERNEEVKRLKSAIADGNAAREKLNAELSAARKDVAERESTIDRMTAEKDELAGNVLSLKAAVKEAENRADRAEAAAGKAETVANEQSAKVSKLLNQIALLNAELESARAANEPAESESPEPNSDT